MKVSFLFGIIASLTLCTLLSIGCIEEEGKSSELRISNIVFCSEEPLYYMEYEEQPNATYQPDDVIWLYFNPENLKYNQNSDETYEIWFTQYLTLTGPNGEIIASQEVINEHNRSILEEERDYIFGANHITLTGEIANGKYTVKIDLTDKLAADKTVSASTNFWISP